jgi:broad specificity phosphatase PhoE
MNKLIIVRAGSTAWQSGLPTADESRIQGTVPLPLSEEARLSLRGMAEVLQREKPDRLYSSGNESSGPTAEFLAQLCNIKTRTLPYLHEQDYGLWQGLRIAEIKQRYGRAYKQWRSDPASVRPPQGETLDETLARVQEALREIQEKNRNKTVVVVAAYIVAALMECILTDTSLEQIWDIIEKGENPRIFDFQQEACLISLLAQP